jgi:hypothetical protein
MLDRTFIVLSLIDKTLLQSIGSMHMIDRLFDQS